MSDELAAKMKAAGMLSIDEILSGNLMGKFSTHTAVSDIPSLLWWLKSQHESYLRMRLEYEVGNIEKDEMYEWVFAHSAVFATISDHVSKVNDKTAQLIREAVTAERERCASACEEWFGTPDADDIARILHAAIRQGTAQEDGE